MIYVIGDSHSIFYADSMNNGIKHYWFGMQGLPVTTYTLLHDQHHIMDFPRRMMSPTPGDPYPVKGDVVMFSYGWNDIQKNIHKYAQTNWKNTINNIIIPYCQYLKYAETHYGIRAIANCIYPNPHSVNSEINGSIEERRLYALYANNLLRDECEKIGIAFFDILDIIVDVNGFIVYELTDDGTHLDRKNKELRCIIETSLHNLSKTILEK